VREGKFFVTGSSIKAADLVIEDASISTPHALMSVGSDGVFKVQDLMSERGLFVRSRDGGQYKREEGTVELKHGDWIRFGDVEFLVALVPTGSGR
jgi:pSer/pThr/pTyr-binding forkhead associated (FHA) protein